MTRPTRLGAALEVIVAAIAMALVAGLAEVAIDGFRHFVLHRFVMTGVDVVWLAPAGTALFMLVAAVPLALVVAASPGPGTRRIVTGLLALMAWFSILTGFRELHHYASLVLAAGLAWRTASFAVSHPERWRIVMRRSAVGTAVVTAVLGLGNAVRLRLVEQQWEREVAARPARAPNILLLILDTVRAANLHTYGYARATSPAIDRLAAEGVVFDRAIAPSSWTLPTHASLFTNRRPGELSARYDTPFDGSVPTLAEALRDRGYRTAGFTANLNYTSRESGLAAGFTHYDGYRLTFRQLMLSAPLAQVRMMRAIRAARTRRGLANALLRFDLERPFEPKRDPKPASLVRREFQSWLDGNDRRPFFAFLNFFDAHDPNPAPPAFDTLFTSAPQPVDRYDRLIAAIDHEIGLIVSDLGRRGELDRTIIVVTSDHGEHFGEHGLNGHGNSLYLELLHVPLVVRYPGAVPRGVRVPGPVPLAEVGPTLFRLAGLDAPVAFHGRSLTEHWAPHGPGGEPVFSEVEQLPVGESRAPASTGPMRSVVDGDWQFIRNGDGTEELYNIAADPSQQHNLASAETGLTARLRAIAEAVRSGY